MKSHWLTSAFLCFFGSIGFAQGAGPATDFDSAVPTDSFALVRLRSVRELVQRIEYVRVRGGLDEKAVDEKTLLGMLLKKMEFRGDEGLVDATRPIGVSFSFGVNSPEPVPTWIVPATDAKALLASMAVVGTSTPAIQSGAYVAFSKVPSAARGGKPSRLLSAGPSGFITARVDLAVVITKFRPAIDVGLGQVQQMADSSQLQTENQPFDMSEMLDMYIEFVRDIVDSADLLEGSLDVSGPELALNIALINLEGSALTKYGNSEKVDYRALAGMLDPQAPFAVVLSYDQRSMLDRVLPMYEGMIAKLEKDDGVPSEFATALRAYLKGAMDNDVQVWTGRRLFGRSRSGWNAHGLQLRFT